MKNTVIKKPKKKSVSQLKKEADNVFSQYVRQKYADPQSGLVACVTCGNARNWKELQNGHYITRGSNILRYDSRNAHPQCVGCNVFKKGNYPAYAVFMVNKYGQSILQELESESKQIKQWKAYELQEIIDHYKDLLSRLA